MSMKIMQNYQYLMQNSNRSDPNLKNLALNSIHYQNCVCKRFEPSDFADKRAEHSNTFCKNGKNSVEGKAQENSDAFCVTVSDETNKRLDTHVYNNRLETPVNYKKNNIEVHKKNDPIESSSACSKNIAELNFYNKIISNNISMNSRPEICNMYPGFETAEMYAKRQVSKLYSKEIGNPNSFVKRNVNLTLLSKRYNSNVQIKQSETSDSFLKQSKNLDISGALIENSNLIVNRNESGDIYNKTVDNFNLQQKEVETENSFLKKSENSNQYSKNVETADLCTKSGSDMFSKSSTYFDEDMQATLARKQLLAAASSTKFNLCDICKKSFSTKGNLQNHHIVHSGQKPHECEVCKKGFSQRSTLGKHYLIHTGEKPHICSVCGRGFRQANNLRIHFLTHSGEKPHLCNICDKGFTQKIALQKHMLTHTGIKPHACDVCKRCFTTKGNLQKHFLIHTGEKPHICNLCNRGFSQKIALKKHHLTHTGEKPHLCNVCGKGFTTKGNLKSHFKRHTREKSSLSQSVSLPSSSLGHTVVVPKSIAQSIMSPLSFRDHSPALSTSTLRMEPKSSPQMEHPLALINPVTTSGVLQPENISSMTDSYALSKSYYASPNQPFALTSRSSVPFSQPQTLTALSSRIPIFNSPTLTISSSPSSVFPPYLQNNNVSSMQSLICPVSESLASHGPKKLLNSEQSLSKSSFSRNEPKSSTFASYLPNNSQTSVSESHGHKQFFTSQPSLTKSTDSLADSDTESLTLQIVNVRSVSPLPRSVSLARNTSSGDTSPNDTMSQGHLRLPQNMSVLTPQMTEDNKVHLQHITIL